MTSRASNHTLKCSIANSNQRLKCLISNKEVDLVWSQFSKFCSYEHIQKIERRIDPFIELVSNKVNEFEHDNTKNKEIIRRFDEVLLDKASKFNITELKLEIEKLLTKQSFDDYK